MLKSLSYHSVLERGFVVVRNAAGDVITEADKALAENRVSLTFRQEKTVEADIVKNEPASAKESSAKAAKTKTQPKQKKSRKDDAGPPRQKELF